MKVSQDQITRLFVAMGVDTATGWDADKLEAKLNQQGGVERYRDDPTGSLGDAELDDLYARVAEHQANGYPVAVGDDSPEPEPAPDASTPDGVPDAFRLTDDELQELAEDVPVTTAPAPAVAQTTRAKPPAKPKPQKKKEKSTVAIMTKPKPRAKPVKKSPSSNGTHAGEKKHWNPHGTWEAWKKFYAKHPRSIPEEGVLRAIYDELTAAGKYKKPRPVTKQFILDVLATKFPERAKEKMANYLNNVLPTGLRVEYGVDVQKEKIDGGAVGYYVVPPAKK